MANKRDIVQFRMTTERREMIEEIRAFLKSIGANHTDNDALDFALRNAHIWIPTEIVYGNNKPPK